MDRDAGEPSSTSQGVALTRRVEDRMIAGVAGGLADYAGTGATWVRIAFVVLALAGGIGVFIYLLCWLMVPGRDGRRLIGANVSGGVQAIGTLLGIGVLALVSALLLSNTGSFSPPSLLWALALAVVGVVLLHDDEPPHPVARTPVTARPRAGRLRLRPLSALTLLTLATLLMVLGALGLLTNLSIIDMSVGSFPALALVIVGVGLVIGTRWGRSRILVLIGLLLVPIVAISSVIDVPLRGAISTSYRYVTDPVALDDRYEFLAASTTFDLSEVDFPAGTTDLSIELGTGAVDVVVPRGITVDVSAHSDAGRVGVFNRFQEGIDLTVDGIFPAKEPEGATLNLNVVAALGSISIRRGYADQRNERRTQKDEHDRRRKERRRDGKGNRR
jgi:phage shock protein PspC (stress-responsive transcriptional regulator)